MLNNIVNLDIIKERKEQYGNNFPCISKLFNNFLKDKLKEPITEEETAALMGLMKISRLANAPEHSDSLVDLINYFYIALNYKDYCGTGESKDEIPQINYVVEC